MAADVQRLGFFFSLTDQGKYIGVPSVKPTKNDLDAHGAFLDLKRLDSEEDISYFKRLQSVIPLRGGANYEGLVHGTTRELGLEEKIGLEISPIKVGSKWLAPAPFAEVTATHLNLYSSYVDSGDNTLELSINLHIHNEGYFLSDVVSAIQSSRYFVAELGPYATGSERSYGLLQSCSSTIVRREGVPGSNFFFLKNQDILPGTLTFSEKSIFLFELSPALVTPPDEGATVSFIVGNPTIANGQYYVDYRTGKVISFLSASGRGNCRYAYRDFPWHVRWSPVAVYSPRDTDYRELLFEDEVTVRDQTKYGLVTAEGEKIYHQIFDKSPCLWGE